MRDKYWSMYEEIVDSYYYYWHYRARAVRLSNLINCISCIASVTSISSWLIWNSVPWLWAIILAAAQMINAIRHLFPFSRQITSTGMLIPEVKLLLNEVDHEWDIIDDLPESEINDRVLRKRNEFALLENKYIGDAYFPRRSRCEKKAINDRRAYFFQHHGACGIKKLEV